MLKPTETIVWGGGCFWCTEAVFLQLQGVIAVTPGYAGGSLENPTYEAVLTSRTGHAEVIKIEYDPALIPFRKLLEVFFSSHDPTAVNHQGHDIGEQYRSIILYTQESQHQEAREYIADLVKSGQYSKPIVTQLAPLRAFYPAEEYHRDYYRRNLDAPYSKAVIAPKVEELRNKHAELLRTP